MRTCSPGRDRLLLPLRGAARDDAQVRSAPPPPPIRRALRCGGGTGRRGRIVVFADSDLFGDDSIPTTSRPALDQRGEWAAGERPTAAQRPRRRHWTNPPGPPQAAVGSSALQAKDGSVTESAGQARYWSPDRHGVGGNWRRSSARRRYRPPSSPPAAAGRRRLGVPILGRAPASSRSAAGRTAEHWSCSRCTPRTATRTESGGGDFKRVWPTAGRPGATVRQPMFVPLASMTSRRLRHQLGGAVPEDGGGTEVRPVHLGPSSATGGGGRFAGSALPRADATAAAAAGRPHG